MHQPSENIARMRRILVERFPKCFMGKGKWKRPLAVGIHKLIFIECPELSRTLVRKAIGDYIMGPMYQRNLKAGVARCGLNGENVGTVTEDDAIYARKLIKRKGWQRPPRRKPQQLKKAA